MPSIKLQSKDGEVSRLTPMRQSCLWPSGIWWSSLASRRAARILSRSGKSTPKPSTESSSGAHITRMTPSLPRVWKQGKGAEDWRHPIVGPRIPGAGPGTAFRTDPGGQLPPRKGPAGCVLQNCGKHDQGPDLRWGNPEDVQHKKWFHCRRRGAGQKGERVVPGKVEEL